MSATTYRRLLGLLPADVDAHDTAYRALASRLRGESLWARVRRWIG